MPFTIKNYARALVERHVAEKTDNAAFGPHPTIVIKRGQSWANLTDRSKTMLAHWGINRPEKFDKYIEALRARFPERQIPGSESETAAFCLVTQDSHQTDLGLPEGDIRKMHALQDYHKIKFLVLKSNPNKVMIDFNGMVSGNRLKSDQSRFGNQINNIKFMAGLGLNREGKTNRQMKQLAEVASNLQAREYKFIGVTAKSSGGTLARRFLGEAKKLGVEFEDDFVFALDSPPLNRKQAEKAGHQKMVNTTYQFPEKPLPGLTDRTNKAGFTHPNTLRLLLDLNPGDGSGNTYAQNGDGRWEKTKSIYEDPYAQIGLAYHGADMNMLPQTRALTRFAGEPSGEPSKLPQNRGKIVRSSSGRQTNSIARG